MSPFAHNVGLGTIACIMVCVAVSYPIDTIRKYKESSSERNREE